MKLRTWNTKFLICLLIVVFSLGLGDSVQAVGVGVKPKEINLTVKTNKETMTEMLVMNVSAEPAIYQIYPDALVKEIKIEPTDFRLEPEGSQMVKVKVTLKSPGRFNTNISVIARPLGNSGFAAASGVKIPITIDSSGLPWIWLLAGLALICLLIFFGVKLIVSKISFKQDKL